MKAIQAADRGGYVALRLVDIPRPQPRAGQALVPVTSAEVTPLDRTNLAGLHKGSGVVILPGASPPASGCCSSLARRRR
jgi:NADPH:quinone reductase-like Zn-dependent oxidoreductase